MFAHSVVQTRQRQAALLYSCLGSGMFVFLKNPDLLPNHTGSRTWRIIVIIQLFFFFLMYVCGVHICVYAYSLVCMHMFLGWVRTYLYTCEEASVWLQVSWSLREQCSFLHLELAGYCLYFLEVPSLLLEFWAYRWDFFGIYMGIWYPSTNSHAYVARALPTLTKPLLAPNPTI